MKKNARKGDGNRDEQKMGVMFAFEFADENHRPPGATNPMKPSRLAPHGQGQQIDHRKFRVAQAMDAPEDGGRIARS